MTCPSCGRENRAGARFCDSCGTRLDAPAEAPRAYEPPEALARKLRDHAERGRGERKQVTVLFADVSGSMDLAESVDPEQWRAIMDRFFGLLSDGVHRYEGTVVQFTGDGIMALFGAPIAHEDHAVRAAHAALRLGRDLAEHAAELRREQGLNFSVRIGLNSGEVVVGGLGDDLQVEFTAIGHTVGLAKRMESLAEPGRVYLTGSTRALLDGFFDVRDLGTFEVKGVREPVAVYELSGVGAARSRLDVSRARGFSRFVGRGDELAVLEDALDRSLAGDGQVVALVGEPGVGKSRLSHEFSERCRARGVGVYHASGAAHARNVPFHAALEMLRGYFGIEDGDTPKRARERIAGRLLLMDPGFAENLPMVFDFLGVPDPSRPAPAMDPDARMRHLLEGARKMVAAHAAGEEPAVNVFEDLHWVDPGSHAFLGALVEAIPGRRAMAVVNFRPGFEAAWMGGPHYREIRLVPLGADAVGELLDHLLGSDRSLDDLRTEVANRTGGNPFFVEELVRALVEDGTLAGPRGARRATRPLAATAVPPSVQAVLAARIDRLPTRDKGVLEAAAVIGKEVEGPVLARVAGLSGDELRDALDSLMEAAYLRDGPDGDYLFNHPLTQEVAYSSQLSERRRELHRLAAEAEAAAHDGDEHAALVAQHFEAAGETLAAARWHARAAGWAQARSVTEAARHWRAVVAACDALPESPETLGLGMAARIWVMQSSWRIGVSDAEVDALHEQAVGLAERLGDETAAALATTAWAGSVGIKHDIGAAVAALEPALATVRAAGRPDVEIPILLFHSYVMLISARYDDALESCARGLELLEPDRRLGAGVVVVDPYGWFYMMRGFLLLIVGDLAGSRRDLERSVELCTEAGDLESAGWAHMTFALLAWFTGVPDGAFEHASRSLEIAERIGSVFSRVWARYNVGIAHCLQESWDEALEVIDGAFELVRVHDTGREAEPWLYVSRSIALSGRGDGEPADEAARAAIAIAGERGIDNVLPAALTLRARALAQGEEALAAVDRAISAASETGARGQLALSLLERADIHARSGDREAELADLERALALFDENGATGHARAVRERLQVTA